MLANIRSTCQRILIPVPFALLALLAVREETHAQETLVSAENWRTTTEKTDRSSPLARICHDSRRPYVRNRTTFVITHGMGGTVPGDRFHQLADAIGNALPECNVLIVDWSEQSWRTTWFGIPNSFAVAQNIDPVAREASELLKDLQVDPAQTTFIGESFGNCVNARVAALLGRRGRILAFNPACEAGGYKTPDLRACSDVAWAFQTYSVFDTQDSVADVSILLETPPRATAMDQHIAGIPWLARRIRSGNLAWLLTTHAVPERQSEYFDAVGTLSGEVLHRIEPRKLPVPGQTESDEETPMIAATLRAGS